MSYGYNGLIESQGIKILVEESDANYQGDSIMLVEGAYRGVGLLIFGWGSCSGCDAYESAHGNPAALQELAEQLVESIKWFPTRTEAAQYVTMGKDWNGTWLNRDTVLRFIQSVQKFTYQPG